MHEVMNFFTTNIWASIDAIVTIFTVIGVWYNFSKNQKQLQKVDIYFNDKKLNLDITRKDISRAELQGILGIFRKDMQKNYKVAYLSSIDYLDSIYKIQKSELDKLVIQLTPEEQGQFKDDIYETNV